MVRYDLPPLMVASLIIIFNSSVIHLVRTRANLQTNTNFLLSSLALSDLLTGLVSIPLHVSCDVIRRTPICIASQLALRFTSISTVSHLFVVTLDRYIGIKHSLRYQSLVTRRRSLEALTFVWASSLAASLIQLSWIRVERENVDDEYDDDVVRHEIRYDVTSLVLYVMVPFAFMSFAYADIFREILRQYRHIRQFNSPAGLDTKRKTYREWKTVATFVAMVTVFLVCWLPYFIVRLQYNLGSRFFQLPHSVEYIFIYSRFCTPLLNPCIYVLGKHDFRQAISASKRRLVIRFRSHSFPSSSVKTTTV